MHEEVEVHFRNNMISAEQCHRLQRIESSVECNQQTEQCIVVHKSYTNWKLQEILALARAQNIITAERVGEINRLANFSPFQAIMALQQEGVLRGPQNSGLGSMALMVDLEIKIVQNGIQKIQERQDNIRARLQQEPYARFENYLGCDQHEAAIELVQEHLGRAYFDAPQ